MVDKIIDINELLLKVEMLEYNLVFLIRLLEGEGTIPKGSASRLIDACGKSSFNAIVEKYDIPWESIQPLKDVLLSMHKKNEAFEEAENSVSLEE